MPNGQSPQQSGRRASREQAERLSASAAFAVGLLIALPQFAPAAEAPPAEELQEIVVTATKRTENIQSVPLAVTALTGEALSDLGAGGFLAYQNRVPGLQFQGVGPNSTQLAMRGVMSSVERGDRAQERTTVGLYVDDTDISVTSANPNIYLVDMERLEVLRGPQGTLFGAGAMSGAVRMITRKPELDSASLATTVAGGFTRYGDPSFDADAIFNVPLVRDRFAIRGVGYQRRVGGYVDYVTVGRDDANELEQTGGRLSARLAATGRLTLTAMLAAQDATLDALPMEVRSLGERRNDNSTVGRSEDSTRIYSLTADYDFGWASGTSVTSHFRQRQDLAVDASGFADLFAIPRPLLPVWVLGGLTDLERTTQELRLTSTNDGRLKWIAGVYYVDGTRDTTITIDVPGIEAFGFPPGQDFGTITDRLSHNRQIIDERQFAAFGETTYALTHSLDLTLGLRYFDARLDGSQGLSGLFFAPVPPVFHSRQEEDGFNPKVNLSYKFANGNLLYAQGARGFRLGGPAQFVPPAVCGDDLAALGLAQAPPNYESDHLWTYELGAKTRWLDRRVTANAATYFTDWSNIQFSRDLPTCAFAVFFNGSAVHVYGFEGELSAQITEALRIGASIALTNSELAADSEYFGPKGADAPFVPKVAGGISIDYSRPLPGDALGTLSADVQYVGDRGTTFNTADISYREMRAYSIVDVRATLARRPWQLQLFVENLFDERAELSTRYMTYAYGSPNTQTAFHRPRTVGLRVSYRFGE